MTRVIFAACLFLAGCAAGPPPLPQTLTVTKTIYVPWAWPEYLKSCPDDPPAFLVPHIAATNPHAGSKAALYLAQERQNRADIAAVADDCRAVLKAAVAANSGAQQ